MSSRQAAVKGVLIAVIVFSVAAAINTEWQKTSGGAVTAELPVQAMALPSPSSSTNPSDSPRARPVIRQAEPTRITIPAIGYQATVGQMSTDANGDVNPPTLQRTYRITDRGVTPGSEAENTVYMACHSYSRGFAPCNLVFERAKPGQHLQVTTPAGTLDYLIETTRLYDKAGEFKSSSEVRAAVPGRLVLVTCLQRNDGAASTQNFVVFAQLAQ